MATRGKLCLAVLILSFLVLCAGSGIATRDPEPKQRERQSEHQRLYHKEENPYVFQEEDFTPIDKNDIGIISILQKFTEKTELLSAIENYRVGFLQINPQIFATPAHCDAEAVLVVAKGRGSITLIREERESFNVESGDIIRVHAGTTMYWINTDEKEKLSMVAFLKTANHLGDFNPFFAGPGGKDKGSYYSAFSPELLQAAFKTKKETLQHMFTKKTAGHFVEVSKKQIQALSQQEKGDGRSKLRINVFRIRPVISNQYGQLINIDPADYEPIQDLDVAVGLANITKGSMIGPFYNSKATKIGIVVHGEGYIEMACPINSKRGPNYQKVSSNLRIGSVIVCPADFPTAIVAKDNGLTIAYFATNAEGNIRYSLAGKNNIMNKMKREAIELTFGKEAERAFAKQNDYLIYPGPRLQEKEDRADA